MHHADALRRKQTLPSFAVKAVMPDTAKQARNRFCTKSEEELDRCPPVATIPILPSAMSMSGTAAATATAVQHTSLERFRKSIQTGGDDSPKPLVQTQQPLPPTALPHPSLAAACRHPEQPNPAASNPLRRFLPSLKRPADCALPESDAEPSNKRVDATPEQAAPTASPAPQHPMDSCPADAGQRPHSEHATAMDIHASAEAVAISVHQESSSDQGTDSMLYLAVSDDHSLHHSGGSSEPRGISPSCAAAAGQAAAAAHNAPHQEHLTTSSVPTCSQHRPATSSHSLPPKSSCPSPSDHLAAAVAQPPQQQQNKQPEQQQQQQRQGSTTHTQDSAAGPATASPTAPSSSQSGTTCQAAVGVGEHPVLPPSFLHPPKFTAAAHSLASISPFDMLMPHRAVASASQAAVDALMLQARATKHKGDELKGKAQWKMGSLQMLVQSSLQFMEACDVMTRMPRSHERTSRIESLYGQTAELLHHTLKNIEVMHASELGKEALRILCERLCAICCMRQAAHAPNKYEDVARRIGAVIKDHGAQLAVAAAAAAGGQGATKQQQQQHGASAAAPKDSKPSHVSPDDSSHSSREVAAPVATGVSASTPPLPTAQQHLLLLPDLGQLQSKLLASSRQVSRYSELIRRSTNSFQVFIERKAVQEKQDAKLACMHMAVVCLDMGMMNGMTLISHATEAMKHITIL
ncbi:MAG: hypothetical protein WDW36_004572 [Sanguina aurantia]